MEDKLLIWKCRRGNRDALRQIYEKYHVDLLKLTIVLTGDAGTAEDIVHGVFVRFAQSIRRLSLIGSLKGYLVTSAVNAARSHHRDKRRHKEQNLDVAATLASTMEPPDQWAIVSEQLERLRIAMAELPYEQREVITLHMQSGMTFRSIARRQHTSLSTVQGRYRYGIDKLRSLLNGELSP
jgi:RNA polymerase sigma-70 factor (ECF subfamily)